MGVGRAPPGTVAQQRFTEHGVAAPASMVHEDGAVRTHDGAMRVRIPPVRAFLVSVWVGSRVREMTALRSRSHSTRDLASSHTTSLWCDGARAPRHLLARTASSGAGRSARVIWYSSGSNPDSPPSLHFHSSGSPHLGYPCQRKPWPGSQGRDAPTHLLETQC